MTRSLLQLAAHQAQVALVHFTFAELLGQVTQCGTTAREQQEPTGFPVDPVDEFHVFAVQHLPHRIDQTPGQAAAGMNRHPRGFVDDQQFVIAEHGRRPKLFDHPFRYIH